MSSLCFTCSKGTRSVCRKKLECLQKTGSTHRPKHRLKRQSAKLRNIPIRNYAGHNLKLLWLHSRIAKSLDGFNHSIEHSAILPSMATNMLWICFIIHSCDVISCNLINSNDSCGLYKSMYIRPDLILHLCGEEPSYAWLAASASSQEGMLLGQQHSCNANSAD